MTGTIDTQIEAIARQTLGIATLRTRNSDALDFHQLAVWQIAAALRQAFRAGRTQVDRRVDDSFCRTKPEIDSEVIHDVAHVTFAMCEVLAEYDEARLPSAYRYHVFDGFPGFCCHAAAARYALSKAFADLETDAWPEIADAFARRELETAIALEHPASEVKLAAIAEDIRTEAFKHGIVEPSSRRRS